MYAYYLIHYLCFQNQDHPGQSKTQTPHRDTVIFCRKPSPADLRRTEASAQPHHLTKHMELHASLFLTSQGCTDPFSSLSCFASSSPP